MPVPGPARTGPRPGAVSPSPGSVWRPGMSASRAGLTGRPVARSERFRVGGVQLARNSSITTVTPKLRLDRVSDGPARPGALASHADSNEQNIGIAMHVPFARAPAAGDPP